MKIVYCKNVDELVEVCASDASSKARLSIGACFTKQEEVSNGLVPFTAKAYHDQKNLNGSAIGADSFIEGTKSLPYRPVLAHVVKDEDGNLDFGAHDYKVTVCDGKEVVEYLEQPVGVITNYSFEKDDKAVVNRAIAKGFIYETYCPDVVEILNSRDEVDCSIELFVDQMHFDDEEKVVVLDKYYCSGLTLLGADHKPGMEGSSFWKDTEAKEFSYSENFESILKQIYAHVDEYLSEKEQKGEEVVDKGKELNEEVIVTPIEKDFEEETVEDVTADAGKEEAFEEHEAVVFADKADETMQEIMCKVRDAFFEMFEFYPRDMFVYQGYVVSRRYGDKVFTKRSYMYENDSVTFGDSCEVNPYWLTEDEAVNYKCERDEMEQEISDLQEKLAEYQMAEEKAAKEAVLADEAYAEFLGEEEFMALKENIDKYDIEEMKVQAELAYAKCVRRKKKKNCEKNGEVFEKTSKTKGKTFKNANVERKVESPYGNIVKSSKEV